VLEDIPSELGRALINAQIGVRFRGQTGKHLLRLSLSAFDPERTTFKLRVCAFSGLCDRLNRESKYERKLDTKVIAG
jgi:hypothetical protein